MEIIRNECISKLETVRILQKAYAEGRIQAKDGLVSVLDDINAADVQPVVGTENMATVSDELICKKCGIYLKDYVKVVLDEDNDGYVDEQHYDYEPKYCPECGAKVKED